MSHLRRWRVAQMNRSVTFNFLLDRVDQILGSLVYLIHITYVCLNPSLVPQRSQHTIESMTYHRDHGILERSQHNIEGMAYHRDHGVPQRSKHTLASIQSILYHRDHLNPIDRAFNITKCTSRSIFHDQGRVWGSNPETF